MNSPAGNKCVDDRMPVAMAVASCLMIVMGKTAENENLDIIGAKADTSYDLVNYRIAAIKVTII
jgi:hypothetical protein